MEATTLLEALRARGASIRLVGDRLGVKPRRALDDQLREAIREHRDELRALLLGGRGYESPPGNRVNRSTVGVACPPVRPGPDFDADLAAAWSWAMDRAREGFDVGRAVPELRRLHAAAYLELALGENRVRAGGDRLAGEIPLHPESVRGLLDSIYRGSLDADLMESGRVRLWEISAHGGRRRQ